jgi:hypothetical protein
MPSVLNSTSQFNQQLNLPLAQPTANTVGISSFLAPITVQQTTNYGLPDPSQLSAEAIQKLATTGNAGSFNQVTSSLSCVAQNGQINVVDSSTSAVVASNLATVPQGVPNPSVLPGDLADPTSGLKVTISQEPQILGSPAANTAGNSVTFKVMPTIQESRAANYKSFTPLQHPGEILKYEGSTSRTWAIEAKLISRNTAEADDNLRMINLIRSWVMPFYGAGTAGDTGDASVQQYLGAPPPILTLTAYGSQMIGPVKCVLENHSWSWPNDVDYIQTSSNVPFPVIMNVSLTMKESWSPAEYSGFDIIAYRNGSLPQAFTSVPSTNIGAKNKQQQTVSGTNTPIPNSSTVDTSQANTATPQQTTMVKAPGYTTANEQDWLAANPGLGHSNYLAYVRGDVAGSIIPQ